MAANGMENGLANGTANGDTANGDTNEAYEVKVPSKPNVGVQASAAVPQMSLGRWIKDTDIEAQVREHAKVSSPERLRGHMRRLMAPSSLSTSRCWPAEKLVEVPDAHLLLRGCDLRRHRHLPTVHLRVDLLVLHAHRGPDHRRHQPHPLGPHPDRHDQVLL